MSEIKYQDHILEAIDQLRRRKARPDADRIFNSLSRRHSINFSDAKVALEKCVENGVVLKVEYKGNISYRNAAKKFSHLKRDSQGEVIRENGNNNHNHGGTAKASGKFTGLLTNAIAELVLQEPDYLELGVPGLELIKNILSKDSVRYTKKYVSILLDKEVESGSLIKMENGNFLVGPAKSDNHRKSESDDNNGGLLKIANLSGETTGAIVQEVRIKKKPGPKPGFKKDKHLDCLSSLGDKKNDGGSLRVGGRRKRAKKVFDPSDNNIPKKRGRPIGSLNKSTIEKQLAKLSDNDSRPESRSSNTSHRDHGGVCSVCHLQNKKGPNDRMIACRECSNKAHFSCLNGDDMMLRMYPDNTWQCPHCKTCVICYETSDAGYLAVCSICADAYHMNCHQPKITEKIKSGSKWLCINCQMPEQLAVNDIQLGFGNIDNMSKTNVLLLGESASPTSPLSGNSSPITYRSPPPSPTPPTLSPQAHINGHRHSPAFSIKSESPSLKDLDLEENIDPSIPDASNWTHEEVYNYFAQYFPEEAKVFKEQEIDGPSLLLMKRIDVLTSLKLKLGPALKIYRHVVKLQVRRDDPKLYWL